MALADCRGGSRARWLAGLVLCAAALIEAMESAALSHFREDTDYYTVLGLDPGARASVVLADIKKGYRSQALKYHPDKHASPEKSKDQQERQKRDFHLIARAYETLSSADKREEYDESLTKNHGARHWTQENGAFFNNPTMDAYSLFQEQFQALDVVNSGLDGLDLDELKLLRQLVEEMRHGGRGGDTHDASRFVPIENFDEDDMFEDVHVEEGRPPEYVSFEQHYANAQHADDPEFVVFQEEEDMRDYREQMMRLYAGLDEYADEEEASWHLGL